MDGSNFYIETRFQGVVYSAIFSGDDQVYVDRQVHMWLDLWPRIGSSGLDVRIVPIIRIHDAYLFPEDPFVLLEETPV